LGREQIGEITAGHLPVRQTVLDKKTGKGGLKKAVLVPVGMLLDEACHRSQQFLGNVRAEADGWGRRA